MDAKHEWDLIRKCREGSSSAFEPLVRENQDRALRMAAALLGDDEAAAIQFAHATSGTISAP